MSENSLRTLPQHSSTRQQQQRSLETLEAEFAEVYEDLCLAQASPETAAGDDVAKLQGRIRYLSTQIISLGGNTRRARRAVHYSAKL